MKFEVKKIKDIESESVKIYFKAYSRYFSTIPHSIRKKIKNDFIISYSWKKNQKITNINCDIYFDLNGKNVNERINNWIKKTKETASNFKKEIIKKIAELEAITDLIEEEEI